MAVTCYGFTKCTAPPVPVRLSYRTEPESVELAICGIHAREVRRLGFDTEATQPAVRVTDRVSNEIRAYAATQPLRSNAWTEIWEAPRDWCDTGCKIFAQSYGAGISYSLRHSRTYGCPVGT